MTILNNYTIHNNSEEFIAISNKFDIKENRIITDFDDITKGVKFSIYRCPNKT